MSEQKYCLYCTQGSAFMEYTHDEPLTESALLEIFREYADTDEYEDPKLTGWTLYDCCDWWQFDCIKAENKEAYENGVGKYSEDVIIEAKEIKKND